MALTIQYVHYLPTTNIILVFNIIDVYKLNYIN